VHAPVASVDVHTFMTEPPVHVAPFVQVVFVPLPLLPPPLLLPLDDPPPSHDARADCTALVQSEHELHAKD
jgi:hypothetical protein